MKVFGIEGLTLRELVDRVKDGSRFVVFHWCIGVGVDSVRRPSAVYFVQPGERAAGRGFWRSLGTLLTGWWSLIPFGPIETIACLRENLSGGRDVTAGVLRTLVQAERLGLEGSESDQAEARPIERPAASHAA
jgi:hypothetical protein